MKKYILSTYGYASITEIDVIRETEHTVWHRSKNGKELQARKETDGQRILNSYNEAVMHGRAWHKEMIRRSEAQVVANNARLAEFDRKYPTKEATHE